MDSSRILIIGAAGQLGKALQAKYPNARAVDRDSFDMTDQTVVEAYDWSQVDVILNAAAYTNVDGAETPEGRSAAWRINATGPSYLSHVAANHDITLVHVSSDYVFDGTQVPHTETEHLTPLSVYGASKAAGDLAVSLAPKHYILRTTWLIGDGPNFVRTMLSLADRGISPSVVADQIGRLTFTDTLVEAINHLLSSDSPAGVYNVTGSGKSASWAEITREIYRLAGHSDLPVTYTTTSEYFAGKIADGVAIALRPLQSEMDLTKLVTTGYTPADWHTDLSIYINNQRNTHQEA